MKDINVNFFWGGVTHWGRDSHSERISNNNQWEAMLLQNINDFTEFRFLNVKRNDYLNYENNQSLPINLIIKHVK